MFKTRFLGQAHVDAAIKPIKSAPKLFIATVLAEIWRSREPHIRAVQDERRGHLGYWKDLGVATIR